MIEAVLCDLDGVLRVWDPHVTAEVERRYGVPEGTLAATAFAPELLQPALTGAVSDDEWRRTIAIALLPEHGIDVVADLVADWSESFGAVDRDVRTLLGEVRAAGVRVTIATNATTRLEADLAALGLTEEVDAVVSSARLGVAKPDPTFYFAAAKLADTEVDRCLLVDGTKVNVDVANAVGMHGYQYSEAPGLRAEFERLGVL
ncbi:MAG: HAD-IA family hydrolase [Streptosporangiales bacterium]|nr:HAD-IA family hydrolase [Streptosporangiales bacterium]